MKYFKPGGKISKKETNIIGGIGAVLLITIWYLVTLTGKIISPGILPNPVDVINSIPDLFGKYNLLGNIWYTVSLNLSHSCTVCITIRVLNWDDSDIQLIVSKIL